MTKSSIYYKTKFSKNDFDTKSSILIFDKNLLKHQEGKRIIQSFPFRYGVDAGEKLKALSAFPKHVENILQIILKCNSKNLTVVSLGGGSVGDFAGFFASVFKRGIRLVHIPSTWLAAIDSAHGGKTALNASHAKNQIGTFYPAHSIYLFKSLLENQNKDRILDAVGELLKISLIGGGPLWKMMVGWHTITSQELWKTLPKAVRAKYKVVDQDPYESKGFRQVLNLGHTMGHVIESALGVRHGEAVGQGLVFALRWSHQAGYMSKKYFDEISQSPFYLEFAKTLEKSLKKLKASEVRNRLLMDKKKGNKDDLYFIFVVRPGLCARQKVKVTAILSAFEKQKRHEVH